MLNPLMLYGLLGLGLPVLIHLINRRRLHPVEFATMRFVEGRDVANVFAMRPRDLPQLLLRLLLLLVFVLLMTRMTTPAAVHSDRSMIVILDNSLSMQREGPIVTSVFEMMREQAGRLIDDTRETDTVSFVLVGDEVFTDTGLIRDRSVLRKAVDDAWASHGGGRALLPTVSRAVSDLRGEAAPDKLVVVFSDWRREELEGIEADEELQRHLLSGTVQLVLIGEPLPRADNVALEQVDFHPSAVHVGNSARLTARVSNYSESENVFDIGLTVASGASESRGITLSPGETAHIDLAHRFDLPADANATANALAGDTLPLDDRRHVPMRIRDSRRIVLVAPSVHESANRDARSYAGVDILRYAMNPEEELGLASGGHTRVVRRTPVELIERENLAMVDAIVLYGIDTLPGETTLEDLKAFAAGGGGIWLIPDDRITPSVFNKTFGGLLDGALIGIIQEPSSAAYVARNEVVLGNQLLAPLVRGNWGDLAEIPIMRYRGMQSAGNARTALTTVNGESLALTAGIGDGRIFLQLFDCDIGSTAFPRSSAFLPLVQTVLDFVAGGGTLPVPDVMMAGGTHYLHFPAFRELGGEVELKGPDVFRFPVDDGGWVRVSGICHAGPYEIRHTIRPTLRPRILSVNPARGESDLTPAGEEDIERVFGTAGVHRIHFDRLSERFSMRREIGSPMLWLLLGALAAEALAGAWFARRRKEVTA